MRCAGCLTRWQADDRAVARGAGLPGLRHHGYAPRDGQPGDAGAAGVVGKSFRRRTLCVPRSPCRADQAAVARWCRAVPADEEAGTGPIRLALDHHDRADRLVAAATGGAARRLRLACAGGPPQAGIGGLITSDSFPLTRRRRRCCARGHRPHRPARRPCNVAASAARGARRGRAAARRLAGYGAAARCRDRQAAIADQASVAPAVRPPLRAIDPRSVAARDRGSGADRCGTPGRAGRGGSGPDKPRPRREARPHRNHGALPAHLPRYEVLIDVEQRDCPCCGGTLHVIDEERSEQLDIVPAHLRVRVTRRPRYGCRACEGAVVVAPAPERPIDGGMATEAMIAHVLVSKFGDSLPLYRQSKMLERQGITLDRSTLSHWVGRACWWLTPLYELVLSTALAAPKPFADDTTLPVLDPGRGKTKTGRCGVMRWMTGPGADRAI